MSTIDNKAKKQFELICNGLEAHLAYREVGDDVLDFYHTFVPPECRGTGTGHKLVVAALTLARADGKKIIPSCPFVPRVIAEHPEFADLVH